MSLTDAEFQQQFEKQSLPPERFDHRGHLRIAWLYLKQNPLERAIEKVCGGINRYATSLGATEKFHYTLTASTVRIMARRLAHTPSDSFEAFLTDNQDLVTDLIGVLGRYYSDSQLQSDDAKRAFQSPDLAPL